MVRELEKAIPRGRCDRADPYEIMEYIQMRTEHKRETRRTPGSLRKERLMRGLEKVMVPGRLFVHKNKNLYVVLGTGEEKGRFICRAHNLRRRVQVRKGGLRLRKVDAGQIKTVLDYRVDLPDDLSTESLEGLLAAVPREGLEALSIDFSGQPREQEETSPPGPVAASALPCEECEHLHLCHCGKKSPLHKLLRDFKSLTGRMEKAEL